MKTFDVVILAAGEGKRMKSPNKSKVLHEVLGRSMVGHAVRSAQQLGARQTAVVVGHLADQVRASLAGEGVLFGLQKAQIGTANAFLVGADLLPQDADVLVLYGDTPLLSAATLRRLLETHQDEANDVTVLTAVTADPTGYGRIVRDEKGAVLRIVEEKNASAEEKAITEFNSGVYVFSAAGLQHVRDVQKNELTGEYYITDALEICLSKGGKVGSLCLPDDSEVMGANDRAQLAQAEDLMRQRVNLAHMQGGVTIHNPATVRIHDTVSIEPDATLEEGVILTGQTTIAAGAVIGAYSVLHNVQVAEGAVIKPHSVLSDAIIGEATSVGPFAHLRPGARLEAGAHVGNFVELKNATLGEGSKAGHLAYIGDATVGAHSNIGAGTIFANYDGANKHHSTVGSAVFVGSNSTLVAPLQLGDAAFVAAGSVVQGEVPSGALVVERSRQNVVDGWARRYWEGKGDKAKAKNPALSAWLQTKQED